MSQLTFIRNNLPKTLANPICVPADDFLQRLAFSSLICNLLFRSSCKILLGESKQMRTFSGLTLTSSLIDQCNMTNVVCARRIRTFKNLEKCSKSNRYTDSLSNSDLCALLPSCIENPNSGVKHDAGIYNQGSFVALRTLLTQQNLMVNLLNHTCCLTRM